MAGKRKKPAAISTKQPPKKAKPPPGKPWKKGQSGNPSGRPADYGHFRELCRSKSPQAVAALELALANGDSASVAAARVLLEYGWGKPSAAPEDLEAVKAGAVQLSQLSREELLAIAALPDEDGA
jgi:hypothetical protein